MYKIKSIKQEPSLILNSGNLSLYLKKEWIRKLIVRIHNQSQQSKYFEVKNCKHMCFFYYCLN